MSTNLRKAQKHMQRATELLNQGQLAFGGPDGVETRAQKRQRKELEELEEKEALKKELQKKQKGDGEEASPDLNMVSDQQIRNVTDHLDSCEHVCTWQRASKRFKNAEINEKLKQKLLLDPENKWPEKKWTLFTACQACQRGKIRLTSMSKEEHNTKLTDRAKKDVEKWALNEMISESDFALMHNIDIIVTITGIRFSSGVQSVTGVLYKDVNGNFTQYNTNMKIPIEIGKELTVHIKNINTPNEYYEVIHYLSFYCNAHQSWNEIKKRMDQTEFPGIKASS